MIISCHVIHTLPNGFITCLKQRPKGKGSAASLQALSQSMEQGCDLLNILGIWRINLRLLRIVIIMAGRRSSNERWPSYIRLVRSTTRLYLLPYPCLIESADFTTPPEAAARVTAAPFYTARHLSNLHLDREHQVLRHR